MPSELEEPESMAMEAMAGAGTASTVKLEVLLSVPPGVITETIPLVAPTGTVAVISISETTVKLVASIPPPKVTLVAPVNCWPESVITDPPRACDGVNDDTVPPLISMASAWVVDPAPLVASMTTL